MLKAVVIDDIALIPSKRRRLKASARQDSNKRLREHCPAEAKAASTKLCPRALETEHYNYLGSYCPVDAKAQYTKYCAGRDYTSMYQKADKTKFQMCMALGTAVEEDRSQASHIPTSTQGAVDAAKQGVNQGINKIKGLFGK